MRFVIGMLVQFTDIEKPEIIKQLSTREEVKVLVADKGVHLTRNRRSLSIFLFVIHRQSVQEKETAFSHETPDLSPELFSVVGIEQMIEIRSEADAEELFFDVPEMLTLERNIGATLTHCVLCRINCGLGVVYSQDGQA